MLHLVLAAPLGFYGLLLFAAFQAGFTPAVMALASVLRKHQRIPRPMEPDARTLLVLFSILGGASGLGTAALAFALFGVLEQWLMGFLVAGAAAAAIGFCAAFATTYYALLVAIRRQVTRTR